MKEMGLWDDVLLRRVLGLLHQEGTKSFFKFLITWTSRVNWGNENIQEDGFQYRQEDVRV